MIDLRLGDCLDLLPTLEAQSIDAVITDIPYGTTACKWDTVIPFEPMWAQLKRIAKPKAAIVLFGSQPFTSALVMSNKEMFKHCLIWDKVTGVGFQIAKYRPLMQHEDICVFGGNGSINYYPIMTKREKPKRAIATPSKSSPLKYYDYKERIYTESYPKSIVTVSNADHHDREHPTQKPVALMEYLVKTYTDEGDTVLDFAMGSGTTGVACVKTNRNFIGFEILPEYFEIAKKRITEAQKQMVLL